MHVPLIVMGILWGHVDFYHPQLCNAEASFRGSLVQGGIAGQQRLCETDEGAVRPHLLRKDPQTEYESC